MHLYTKKHTHTLQKKYILVCDTDEDKKVRNWTQEIKNLMKEEKNQIIQTVDVYTPTQK